MNTKKIIEDIIDIPCKWNLGRGKSLNTLLSETGYLENVNYINERGIKEALLDNPDAVKMWMQFSDDKRAEGWGISYNFVADTYNVSDTTTPGTNKMFTDKFAACAYFILGQITGMRMNLIGRQKKLEHLDPDTLQNIIAEVLGIPHKMRTSGNISFSSVLIAIPKYRDSADLINKKNIEEVLRKRPELIDEWLLFSKSQMKMWHFYYDDISNEYVIDYLPHIVGIIERRFPDRFDACSAYILSEITSAR